MGKKWDYAELSKLAKRFDGPKNMVEALQKNSFLKGFKAGKAVESPKKLIYGVLGVIVGAAGLKIYEQLSRTEDANKARELSEEESAAIEQELVDGIKQYDSEMDDKESASEKDEQTDDEESI